MTKDVDSLDKIILIPSLWEELKVRTKIVTSQNQVSQSQSLTQSTADFTE
ncbi:MAG: hypothetical protein AB4290_01725 [Spirulina sp.]